MWRKDYEAQREQERRKETYVLDVLCTIAFIVIICIVWGALEAWL